MITLVLVHTHMTLTGVAECCTSAATTAVTPAATMRRMKKPTWRTSFRDLQLSAFTCLVTMATIRLLLFESQHHKLTYEFQICQIYFYLSCEYYMVQPK